MRRIRISTWVLTAIFLAALVAYLLVKPSSASIIGPAAGPEPAHAVDVPRSAHSAARRHPAPRTIASWSVTCSEAGSQGNRLVNLAR